MRVFWACQQQHSHTRILTLVPLNAPGERGHAVVVVGEETLGIEKAAGYKGARARARRRRRHAVSARVRFPTHGDAPPRDAAAQMRYQRKSRGAH